MRWADNVVEESTTTTTGAYQLVGVPASGEAPGTQGFVAGIGNAQTCYYYAKEVSGTAWERGIGTVTDAATDTLTRTAIHGSSNGGAAVDWTGKTLRVYCVNSAHALQRMTLDHAGLMENVTLVTSRAAGAETIAVKTLAGTDPSPSDPCRVGFAKTDGTFEVLEITSALSVTLSSGSTLGATSAEPFRIWGTLFNDAGTVRLGVVKCALADGIRSLFDNLSDSSTAEGGAGAADSAGVIYSGTAVTSKTTRVLGYLEYTLTTAGTWDAAPSLIKLWSAGDKLPGDIVQVRRTYYSGVATGTTIIPSDDTIPQISEGTQFMAQAIIPKSAANLLSPVAYAMVAPSINSGSDIHGAMFIDAQVDAIFAVTATSTNSNFRWSHRLQPQPMVAGSTSSITFSYRAGQGATGTVTFNGFISARTFGGVNKSFIEVTEIMT